MRLISFDDELFDLDLKKQHTNNIIRNPFRCLLLVFFYDESPENAVSKFVVVRSFICNVYIFDIGNRVISRLKDTITSAVEKG